MAFGALRIVRRGVGGAVCVAIERGDLNLAGVAATRNRDCFAVLVRSVRSKYEHIRKLRSVRRRGPLLTAT